MKTPKEVEKIITAAKYLQDFCNSFADCKECPFHHIQIRSSFAYCDLNNPFRYNLNTKEAENEKI